MNPSQITDWCHQIIRSVAKKDGLYIDATMGMSIWMNMRRQNLPM